MVHFWVVADMVNCKEDKQCREWAESQYACLREFPLLDSKPHDLETIPRLPWKSEDGLVGSTIKMAAVRDVYHKIAGILDSAIAVVPPTDRFVCVLDARQYSNMGKDGMSSLKTVQGLLILAFPDVLWIPIFKGGEETAKRDIRTALDLVAGGFNPMFDGLGIRSALMRAHAPNSEYPSYRDDVAVSIDEERHFAELTAYTAFRFGYRAFPVSTARLARKVLEVDDMRNLPSLIETTELTTPSLVVFEDGDIKFPDATDSSNNEYKVPGEGRDRKWRLLETAELRVLATACTENEDLALAARTWFDSKEVNPGRKGNAVRISFEKFWRRLFNVSPGGMIGVCFLAFEIVALATVFGWLLVRHTILLVPALFLGFVAFGLLRSVVARGITLLFHHKIRSQWRFYPKRFVGHFPYGPDREKKRWCFVRKPLGGVFGFRNQCGLPNGQEFGIQLDEDSIKKSYWNAWNGRAATKSGKATGDSSHSANGMLPDVASNLIGRARALKNRDGGVEDAIHAAVLATCAYELLGHKTPALSIEALGLRHYCEVLAECEFPGVRAQLDMEDRLIDIHNSMSQICRDSNGDVREDMFASGMAAICDNLADLLRSRGRFSEAAFMTRRARYMHRLLLPFFGRHCLAYPEWVIRSPWHCAASFAAVVVAFCLYWTFQVNRNGSIPLTFARTWEVLVCDEPDLSRPGRDIEARYVVVKNQPDTEGSDISVWDYAVFEAPENKERSQVTKQTMKKSVEPIPRENYSLFVHTMRQIALLHLAFLGIFFWDAMRKD